MNLYSVLDTQTIIPSAQPTNEGKSVADLAKEKAEKEKVDFLQLLLTQLVNQNPLDPMDTDEWTAQLTRYSILEQGIDTNQHLSETNDLLRGSTSAANFNYIGKEVEVETNINVVHSDEAKWSYIIEGSASEVKLTITDSSGSIIDEVDGSISSGAQSFTFDAATYGLSNGDKVTLSINAKDSHGASLKHVTTANITVDGVWSDGDKSYLTAGEISFRTSDVLKIIE